MYSIRSIRSAFPSLASAGALLGMFTIGATAHAAEPQDKSLHVDLAGKVVHTPPKAWTPVSSSEKDGKLVLEYRFEQPATPGHYAYVRLSLRQIVPSSKLKDLTSDQAQVAQGALGAAVKEMSAEIDAMPGMKYISGGTQAIYTAEEQGKRFHYMQFINLLGVERLDSDRKPLFAVGLRCRSAVDESAPNKRAADDQLDSLCYDIMLGLQN
jgi:hypothetical protein